VLTRPAAPNDVVDLTEGFVTGSASTYAGGASTRDASVSGAARARARPIASPMPPPTPAPSFPSSDRSRRPALAGGFAWDCRFPPEADANGIDGAVAAIRVDLDVSGAVRNVSIESDPGHGFGSAARRCALTKRWTPALDRDGNPVESHVAVHVRFVR
jgi:protein TonB